mmetsp:Transcript_180173/g.571790  ORF Transcript_180173/g.571790 Transcript_180173/m.571790 type:complete len:279 (+) Transcript_180173:551-1387(+)
MHDLELHVRPLRKAVPKDVLLGIGHIFYVVGSTGPLAKRRDEEILQDEYPQSTVHTKPLPILAEALDPVRDGHEPVRSEGVVLQPRPPGEGEGHAKMPGQSVFQQLDTRGMGGFAPAGGQDHGDLVEAALDRGCAAVGRCRRRRQRRRRRRRGAGRRGGGGRHGASGAGGGRDDGREALNEHLGEVRWRLAGELREGAILAVAQLTLVQSHELLDQDAVRVADAVVPIVPGGFDIHVVVQKGHGTADVARSDIEHSIHIKEDDRVDLANTIRWQSPAL